jgi:ribosomal RNA-processing protein 7
MVEIKGYHVLPVHLPRTKALHYIFYKKHEIKASDKEGNQSLFMINLPIASDLATLKRYFSQVALGATIESFSESLLNNCVEDVWIDLSKLTSELELTQGDDPRTRLPKNCGIVNFVDKSALSLAYNSLKKLSNNLTSSSWPIIEFDSSYYYNKLKSQIYDSAELSQDVSQSLIQFDKLEAESIQALKNQTELVDEDGFTLVVGSHRKTKAGILGKQKLVNKIESAKSKKNTKEKQDFYKFQLRQRKKDEMNELLTKFKSDQEKVRLMKEKKRFRPY